jgi:hypothetical protein
MTTPAPSPLPRRHVVCFAVVAALVLGADAWMLLSSSGCGEFHLTHHVEVHAADAADATPTPPPHTAPWTDGYQLDNDRTEAR